MPPQQPDPSQLPPGYTLDTPGVSAGSNLSPAALQELHAQAVQAQPAARNPFDQCDTPPTRTDAAPGPSSALPPGYTLDPPAYGTGLLARVGGIAGRGVLEGASGVVGTAQAAGRWLETHTPAVPLVSNFDATLDAVPVQSIASAAADRAGFYKPQQASGKILEGAVGGATGAALTGGLGVLPMTMAADAGAAVPLAKAAGASDDTAAAIGLATALLPVGGVGVIAARNGAGTLAKNAYVGAVARNMAPDAAAQHVILNDALSQYAAGAGKQLNPAQTVQGYTAALNDSISQYRKLTTAAGITDADQSTALMAAQRNANAGTGGQADAQSLGLPGYHQGAVAGALGQLQALAGKAPSAAGNVGPIAAATSKLTPIAAGVSAVGAAHAGDWLHGAELAAAALAGKAVPGVSSAISRVGGIGDWLLGSGMSPADAQLQAAQPVVRTNGLDVSGSAPLADLQSAVSDARGQLNDNSINVQNAASDALKAKQTAAAYNQAASDKAANDIVWGKALAQQSKQNAVDPLSSALWPQQQTSPNLQAVTNSQVRGFQADQSGLAKRDASEQAAEDALKARGLNLADQAGNWTERRQIQGFKQSNPGEPITGSGMIAARTPAAPIDPRMAQGGSTGAPPMTSGGPSAASIPAPATPLPGPATAPSASLQGGFTGLPPSPRPVGGQALVSQIVGAHYGGPQPLAPEVMTAANDLAADGIGGAHFDALQAGQTVHPDYAHLVAARVSDLRTQQQVGAQATNDVQQAIGAAPPAAQPSAGIVPAAAVPNGGARGPVQNVYRYGAAVRTYRQHASDMGALAGTSAEKQAISQIAAEKTAAGKTAILQSYLASNPGADTSRFTPQLMKGT